MDRRQPVLPADGRARAPAFAQLVAELTAGHEQARTGLGLAVDHLVLGVVRAMSPAATPQLALHPAVGRVKLLLDQQFEHRWTLGEMAGQVGLAPAYLAELFVRELGQPPHRYLTERRIDRARQLLASSDLSITAIALSLGFSSSQHFARVFRQVTATTPTTFRGHGAAHD